MSTFAAEDQTVAKVREAANATFQACDDKTHEQWNSCWDGACLAIATQMESEGLMNTAKQIREMIGKAKKFK